MTFTIDDKEYSIKQYSKMNLGEFLNLIEQEPKMPELLRDIYSQNIAIEDVTNVEYSTILLPYFVAYVAFATDAPKVELLHCEKQALEQLYNVCLQSFQFDSETFYNPEIRTIKYKGMTFSLPKRFMKKTRVIDFIDAAQFERFKEKQKGNELFALRELLLLLLRENWNERTVIDEEYIQDNLHFFDDMPMIDVLQVYFFLQKRNDTLEIVSQIATKNQRPTRLGQV